MLNCKTRPSPLPGSEGAAGSIYDYIRCIGTRADGRRIAFTFVLHSVNPGVFDSPPPPFDRAREVITFWTIIGSLRPLNEKQEIC